MIGDVSRAEHIYIVCGYTDMRKSIDGLAAIIQQNFTLKLYHKNPEKSSDTELFGRRNIIDICVYFNCGNLSTLHLFLQGDL